MPSDTVLLKPEELAAILKVQLSTVLTLARTKRIPCVRISPKILRFDRDAVFAALGYSKEPASDAS